MPHCQQCGSEVGADRDACRDCGSEHPATAGDGSGTRPSEDSAPDPDQPVSRSRQHAEPATGWTPGKLLLAAGVVITLAAAYLPWVTASAPGRSVSISGLEHGGRLTIIVAGFVGPLAAWRWSLPTQAVAVLAGVLVSSIALVYLSNPLPFTDLRSLSVIERGLVRRVVQPGIGTYLTALGGLGLVCGGTYGVVSS